VALAVDSRAAAVPCAATRQLPSSRRAVLVRLLEAQRTHHRRLQRLLQRQLLLVGSPSANRAQEQQERQVV